jgi:hypothetical protein
MDEQCLNSFVVARGLLERGTVGLDGTPPSAIAAIILYDVAVETAAKATLRARPSPSAYPGVGYVIPSARRAAQVREHLPWVLDRLLASYRELLADDQAELPALQDARAVHEYRNTVHHHGTVPSSQDLERHRFRATDFIDSLAFGFFGRQLTELSRASMVQNEKVRVAIEAAEQALAGGDLISSIEWLSIAFESARVAFRLGQPYDRERFISVSNVRNATKALSKILRRSGVTAPREGVAELERVLEVLVQRSERAEDRLEALVLGAQVSDYVWFQSRFPRAHRPNPGIVTKGPAHWRSLWRFSWRSDPSEIGFSREEVIRGLEFVTTVALHWQQFPSAPSPESEPSGQPGSDG